MMDEDPMGADGLTGLFRTWADGVVRNLPLYRRLCGAARDPEVAGATPVVAPAGPAHPQPPAGQRCTT